MALAWPTSDPQEDDASVRRSGERLVPPDELAPNWEELYEAHFDFIWRSLRRLGVAASGLDDAAQEVFLVAYRRARDFEGRSTVKTWLFGIAWNVARRAARAPTRREEPLSDHVASDATNQEESASRAEAVRALYGLLDELDAEKRAVFVMAELEEMTAPEIAEIADIPLNTVYSRLRTARSEFEAALKRRRARDGWRQR
ncbi:MAG TPA: RNA polymerase sigma factor [Polyangiaceae bacterium]